MDAALGNLAHVHKLRASGGKNYFSPHLALGSGRHATTPQHLKGKTCPLAPCNPGSGQATAVPAGAEQLPLPWESPWMHGGQKMEPYPGGTAVQRSGAGMELATHFANAR